MELIKGIEVLHHSSIRIHKERIVYVDPYEVKEEYHDADFVFVTHAHYDHFSCDDIQKVMNDHTILIATQDVIDGTKEIQPDATKRIVVKPNQEYNINGLHIQTTVAYNENKPFHPKKQEWVGYIIAFEDAKVYIAGDTDHLKELESIRCDIALVPIGGTYTMNFKEAADLINAIHPKIAIPTHYGSIVGTKEDATNFKTMVHSETSVIVLL